MKRHKRKEPNGKSLPANHMVSGRTSPNPFDRNTPKTLLNELDILPRILGQILIASQTSGSTLPAGESDIFDLDLFQNICTGRIGHVELSPVRKNISNPDLDFLKIIQNIQFGQIQRRVMIYGVGITGQDQIKPSTPSLAAGSNAEFPTRCLQFLPVRIVLFAWEWSGPDSRGVRFDYPDYGGDIAGIEGEPLDGAAETGG